ncbi:MAG: hypothetical protein JRI57_06095 [Deltaproteobacteria bacterium]|nr:hypothetical protein [Deltaproteobacteria bacterium]MBW1986518.1 hypothetical protein [Deltaproteobacteria bacterium]MBW2135097.1 hypothetical protein [Deltaproteobacteria bacterium]
MFGYDLSTLIIILLAIGIFFLLREVNCWYWKINERIILLEEILTRLENMEKGRPPAEAPEHLSEISID